MLKKLLFFLSLVGILEAVGIKQAASWSYGDIESWATSYPNCGGSSQSPINIDTKLLNKKLQLKLIFKNFDVKPNNMSWINNGHSAVLRSTYNTSNMPTIQNLENGETYVIDALHYHWGPNNSVGSEHTIKQFSYPIEMHIVSWNQRYGSLANAVSSPNGLLVLGNFYLVSKSASKNYHLKYLCNILEPDVSFALPITISLKDILAKIPKKYFFYSGSLTTPTCDETVQWVVIKKPLKISAEELAIFRTLKDQDGNPITRNYRPVQPLNGRTVGFN